MSIYLDYNATSPLREEVKAEIISHMDGAHNASSIHSAGRAARKTREDARRKILEAINAPALTFCGTATEANNLALAQSETHIISAIEHDAVFKPANNPILVRVDSQGLLDFADLETKLEGTSGALVSVILGNNETGVIQDVKRVAEIAHQHGALVHTDAAQAFGKIPLDFADLGVDMLTLCPHKLGGPAGVAALVHQADLELKPILIGGGQEQNKRPGTQDIAAIAGFGKLAEIVSEKLEDEIAHMRELQEYMEAEILKIAPDAVIFSSDAPRLPNTTNVTMPGVEAATQVIAFDMDGICISSGCACNSGKVKISRILQEMNAQNPTEAIRISIGYATTQDEVEKFLEIWEKIYKRSSREAA